MKKNTSPRASLEHFKASSLKAFHRVKKEVKQKVVKVQAGLMAQIVSDNMTDKVGLVVFGAGAALLGVLQWIAIFMIIIALAKVIAGFVVVFWPLLIISITLLLAGLSIRASIIDNPLEGLFN